MKWKNLGKIFDPRDFNLPNNCVEFAKSPQAIVFDDFVRIYFSTIERQNSNSVLSHIAYVDFDKCFKNIIRVSNKNVIELGSLGCFDEHGIFPINVLKDNNRILAYTTGWSRRVTVSVETSIGLAISNDNGCTFKKVGLGPVLSSSLHEPFLVCDAFVAKFGELYHMWYIFGTKWIESKDIKEPERVYKIAHAFSINGTDWVRDSKPIIEDRLNENECQALPTVFYKDSMYHMYFCYREAIDFRNNKQRGYRIGYAYSTDLLSWKRNDEISGFSSSGESWDSDMQCYPHAFQCNNKFHMLYNGNEFGKYGFGLAILEE
ncbi:MAG: hypothetical protein AB7V36_11715 [Bacteroidales bacterium]